MRRTFGKIITELADKDEKIYVLVGDIGYRVFDEFREKHPDRFINMGICEQSIISVSSGMALEGLNPGSTPSHHFSSKGPLNRSNSTLTIRMLM